MIIGYILSSLALGMVYALVAVGYSTVFGTLRIINFAHGTVYAFGSFMSWLALTSFGWNPLLAVIFSMVLAGLLNMIIEWFGLRPLRTKQGSGVSAMITTIGLSYIIQNMMDIVFGSEFQHFPAILNFGSFQIGQYSINTQQILVTLVALILMAVLMLIINKTSAGLAMRAVAQNSKAAAITGIRVNQTISFTFMLAGMTAAIAGTFIGGYYQMLSPAMGSLTGLKAFSAAVLGGVGSVPGSILGGLAIGFAEVFGTALLGGGYTDSIPFVILFIVLLVRPTGFFGQKGVIKV